jgi:hypothetical protein
MRIDDPLLAPNMEPPEDEHTCLFNPQDCDICKDCGEHADFCEECGSECCGARPMEMP